VITRRHATGSCWCGLRHSLWEQVTYNALPEGKEMPSCGDPECERPEHCAKLCSPEGMAEFAVSSPFGPLPYRVWTCLVCTESGKTAMKDPAPTLDLPDRQDAITHVSATGHDVQWFHGMTELLTALRTAAGEEAGDG
jgi:hypothetical protein